MDGYNVCVFAYGQVRYHPDPSLASACISPLIAWCPQTGSGKTYTMEGDLESNPGIKCVLDQK